MALTKETIVDRVEVVENGAVQVRTTIIVKDGDELVSRTFVRHVINPGDDYTGQANEVKEICKVVHTKAKIAAYREAQKASVVALDKLL